MTILNKINTLRESPYRASLAADILRTLHREGIVGGTESDALCGIIGEKQYGILAKAIESNIHIVTFYGTKKAIYTDTLYEVQKHLSLSEASMIYDQAPVVTQENTNTQEQEEINPSQFQGPKL